MRWWMVREMQMAAREWILERAAKVEERVMVAKIKDKEKGKVRAREVRVMVARAERDFFSHNGSLNHSKFRSKPPKSSQGGV